MNQQPHWWNKTPMNSSTYSPTFHLKLISIQFRKKSLAPPPIFKLRNLLALSPSLCMSGTCCGKHRGKQNSPWRVNYRESVNFRHEYLYRKHFDSTKTCDRYTREVFEFSTVCEAIHFQRIRTGFGVYLLETTIRSDRGDRSSVQCLFI